jgi:hypothetical protein
MRYSQMNVQHDRLESVEVYLKNLRILCGNRADMNSAGAGMKSLDGFWRQRSGRSAVTGL